MNYTFRRYNVFISSPNDVERERNIADQVISTIDTVCKEVFEISLEVKRWEKFPPVSTHVPEQKIQDRIDIQVKNSHFFVLILNKRYGTIEPGHTISNTEREINTILSQVEKNRAIKILSYFKKNPLNNDIGEQEKKVNDLKDKLSQLGILHKEYETEEEFKDSFTHAIYEVILKMQLTSFKKLALRNFWQLGNTVDRGFPEVAIIYPPVPREYMKPLEEKDFWLGRLQPTIFFEDYKGLFKVRKCLSLIGFHNSNIYPDTDMPDRLNKVNRVWICLPRLPKATQYLEKYSDVARFIFHPRTNGKLGHIVWMTETGAKIKITSPLKSYMEEQRVKMDYQHEWNSQLGKIIAKDYAIIARFRDVKDYHVETEELLHDYFFGGIRGLGTWGAAWFLDRRAKHFVDIEPDSNIQILLEVTYENGKIKDVVDVSNQNKAYFQKECSLATIRANIKEYNQSEHK